MPISIKEEKQFQKTEIKALKECTAFVLNKNTANLQLMYNVCKNKNTFILLEYYDMDMLQWIKKKHTKNEWLSAYFQIFCGLYCLEKHSNFFLQDIKFENILVKKIKDKYLNYKINNKIYSVPTYSYLFVLTDFGMVSPKNKGLQYSTHRIDNNTIKYYNLEKIKDDIKINIMKKNYKDIYDKIKKKSTIKIKYNDSLYIDGKKASKEQLINSVIVSDIDKYIANHNNIYKKLIKKEIYKQQPAEINNIFGKLNKINFVKLYPKVFKKYISNDYDKELYVI